MINKMSTDRNRQKELIQKYISGDISVDEASNVESMINNDPELRSYLERSEKVWELVGSFDTIEPNPNFISNFWDRVRDEKNRETTFLEKIRSINIRWAFISSFATILLVSAFLINIFVIDNGSEKKFVFDDQDEVMLKNLDRAITKKTAASLEVFGPWEE